MHGSPLSKYDNKMLWGKYDYHDFGIIGEPYFDVNFEEVLYLTDTGRRWDGKAVSVRDKATGVRRRATGEEQKAQGSELRAQGKEQSKTKGLRDEETEGRRDEEQPATSNQPCEIEQGLRQSNIPHGQQRATFTKFHSTFDIIDAAKNGKLPNKIMITVHPQRWDNRTLPWIKELVWQNIKNLGKRLITSSMHNSA
jgi:hypothetical protein